MSSSGDRPALEQLADLRVSWAARAYRHSLVRLEMASTQLLTTLERNDIGPRGAVRRGRPVEIVSPLASAYMSALDAKNLADRVLTAALVREREKRADRLRAVLAGRGACWPDGLGEQELCLILQRMAGEPASEREWSIEEVGLAEELSELVLAHLDGDQAVLESLPGTDLGDLPLVMVGDFAPRIVVGDVSVQHAQWWFSREEIVTAEPFRAVQRLRGRHRLPRHCVARSTADPARFMVDLDVPLLVEAVVHHVAQGGDLLLTERPGPVQGSGPGAAAEPGDELTAKSSA
jgi:hypothetical protein